ncbi:MAG: DUF4097 domain-containing protein [Treponema sp.]|nr:DUF4097 domain-containing protein [Treponema sp.]
MGMKKIGAAGALLLLLAGAGGYAQEDLPLVNTQNISLEGVENLSVSYGSGDVIIRKSDSEELVIREYLERDRPRYYVDVAGSGDTVQIRRGRRPLLPWLRQARAEIYLPPSFRGNLRIVNSSGKFRAETDILDCKTIDISVSSGSVLLRRISAGIVSIRVSSGDLDIGGVGGGSFVSVSSGKLRIGELSGPEHRLKTSSGRTRIGLLQGSSNIETSSGSITIERALGRMEARASSGSITVEDFSGEGSFEMSSGRINLDIRELAGDLRFNLSSGAAKLNLPGELSFHLDAVTRSGKVLVNEGGAEVLQIPGDSTVLRSFGLPPESAADPAKQGSPPARTIHTRLNSGTVIINRR